MNITASYDSSGGNNMLKPKLFTVLQAGYTKDQLVKDILAGFIVGIIAIPLSIALAIASGVSPEKGLITAIIGGFLISVFGGSRVQIGGPTGAFVVIVYKIIQDFGYNGLVIASIMAGIMLIIMGLLKFGSAIKFIPHPITTGFTSGIAVVIFSQQIKDFLGLKMEENPSEFIQRMIEYGKHIGTIQIPSLVIGIIALAILIGWPHINKRIPGAIIAIIITTVLAQLFSIPVETIGSRFSDLKAVIPFPSVPHTDWKTIRSLIQPAFTIAILAGIESLLSAVVSDGMIGGKHRSNMELVAQGIANIGSVLFGGIPATGAIARTAANVRNGGRTPVAGIVHSITVLLIMIVLMPFAKLIPMTTLAAILMVVAFNMSEIRVFKGLLKAPKADVVVLLLTFGLTVIIDLVVAIEVGIVLAAFLFMKRMADSTTIQSIKEELQDQPDIALVNPDGIDPRIQIYQIDGPFFFGAADSFTNTIQENIAPTRVMILRFRHVPFMDATAYQALSKVYSYCRRHRILLMFTQVQEQPMAMLEKNGFIDLAGRENFLVNMEAALPRAAAYMELHEKYGKHERRINKEA